MFSISLQTAKGILNSLICVAHFSNNFKSVFHWKGSWNSLVLQQYAKKKEQIGYLEYSLLMVKIHYIYP